MEGKKKCALVAGASGVIGRNLALCLDKHEDWDIITLGRRSPDYKTRAKHINVDLLDLKNVEEMLAGLTQVTHIFFAAYVEKASQWEQVTIKF